jgi:hypothetical protein
MSARLSSQNDEWQAFRSPTDCAPGPDGHTACRTSGKPNRPKVGCSDGLANRIPGNPLEHMPAIRGKRGTGVAFLSRAIQN